MIEGGKDIREYRRLRRFEISPYVIMQMFTHGLKLEVTKGIPSDA